MIDYNRIKKRFWKQKKSNTKFKLKLKAIKAQFENISDYLKKKVVKQSI